MSGKPTWARIGSSFEGIPTVVSWAPGRTDVFVVGPDNGVYQKWQSAKDGAWAPAGDEYASLGGKLYSNVTAVSWNPGRIDIFGIGTNNACYHKWWENGWSDWENLGGEFIGDIASVTRGPNRIDLVGRGMNNSVFYKSFDPTKGWLPGKSDWTRIGGIILGSPKILTWANDRFDVVVRGTDNAIYRKTLSGMTWFPSVDGWDRMGGISMGDAALSSWGPERLDIWVRGTDNAVYQEYREPNRSFANKWPSLGGTLVSEISAVGADNDKVTLAVQGINNALFVKKFENGVWKDWKSWGGIITDTPVVHPRGGAFPQVFARGTDGALYVCQEKFPPVSALGNHTLAELA